jgi:hypothetical protein
MLYGTDYRSPTDPDSRLVRRYRRDVMFDAARPQEVVAAGLVAGLAVVPLLVGVSSIVAFLFSIVFGGPAAVGSAPPGDGVAGLDLTPTSRQDFILVLAVVMLTLSVAGGLSAFLRRYDYRRRGGLQYYLHHPRSAASLAGFFGPITLVVVGGLLWKVAHSPHGQAGQSLVSAPSLIDRGVLYVFFGVLVSSLLYLVWEGCFPLILPTLSTLDVDAEVARRQRDDRARILAEEERLRRRGDGGVPGQHWHL